MAERSHWWTERWLRSPLFLSLSLSFSLFLSLSLTPGSELGANMMFPSVGSFWSLQKQAQKPEAQKHKLKHSPDISTTGWWGSIAWSCCRDWYIGCDTGTNQTNAGTFPKLHGHWRSHEASSGDCRWDGRGYPSLAPGCQRRKAMTQFDFSNFFSLVLFKGGT